VDDSAANRSFIQESLADEFSVVVAEDGTEALAVARRTPAPALILLDVNMPGIDGYETCRLLKEDPRTRSIPVIFLTSLSKEEDEERGLSLGAVDYIRKPFSVPILKARVRTQLELLRYREYLETLVEERTRALRETQKEVIFRLAQAAEYRDNDTGSHIKRIGYYSAVLAERLDFPRVEVNTLFYASSMHDIGKIGIPDNILLKPGKLDDEEWVVMKQHPTIGAGLLEGHPSDLLRVAARVARTHHEKWDGTGYPAGLSGEEIPMEGRIVAICDVFDALLSIRPYKRAWTFDESLDEINRYSGRHFDPVVVHTFNDVFPELVSIKKRFAE
jgi:putative two-component system response regulator